MRKTVVEEHFDKIAEKYDFYKNKNRFYYNNLKKLLNQLIPTGSRVLEIGCGTGDLLAAVNPKEGYGLDISSEMIKLAKSKYVSEKYLKFSTLWPKAQVFDYIFMSDVVEHLEEPCKTLKQISELMNCRTVFVNTMANPIWEPLLIFGERLGFKMPEGKHKRVRFKDIECMLKKAGLKIVDHDHRLLVPVKISLLTDFINKYLERYFKKYAFIEYFVAEKI